MVFRGCYVAIVTPFTENKEVNEEVLREHIEFLIERGVAGIVPCGTTGESPTLSWEEHNHVVDIAREQAKGRVQVIAGAGSNNTVESLAAAKHAREIGADAVLCITPYYNRPTQEGLYQHFGAIAKQVDIPLVVYNVPSRTGANILPETIERLCEFQNIVAVKEASGSILQVSEIHRRCGDHIAILSGDDPLTFPILACGGTGVISVTANIAPEKVISMIDAFFAKDFAKALSMHETLLPLSQGMFIETNPITVKTAMNLLGMKAGPLRLPLTPMNERNKQELTRVLLKSGYTVR